MGLRVLEMQEERVVGVLASKDDLVTMREKVADEVGKMGDRVLSTNVRIDAIGGRMADSEARLTEKITETNERIAQVETKLTGKIADVETKLTKRISDVEISLTGKIAEVETKLTGKIAEVETKLTKRISDVETSLTGKIAETNERIAQVETRLTDKITEATAILHSDNKTQFRWFIGILIAMFGVLVTVMLSKG